MSAQSSEKRILSQRVHDEGHFHAVSAATGSIGAWQVGNFEHSPPSLTGLRHCRRKPAIEMLWA